LKKLAGYGHSENCPAHLENGAGDQFSVGANNLTLNEVMRSGTGNRKNRIYLMPNFAETRHMPNGQLEMQRDL